MTGTVLYEVSNGVARITLKRSPVNALDLEMIKSVVKALEKQKQLLVGYPT
jgi:enoyl-CoA hydratase/carnithine racemase